MFVTIAIIIMLVAIILAGVAMLDMVRIYNETVEELNDVMDENLELKRIIVENACISR